MDWALVRSLTKLANVAIIPACFGSLGRLFRKFSIPGIQLSPSSEANSVSVVIAGSGG